MKERGKEYINMRIYIVNNVKALRWILTFLQLISHFHEERPIAPQSE